MKAKECLYEKAWKTRLASVVVLTRKKFRRLFGPVTSHRITGSGNILIADGNVREGYIRVCRQELGKELNGAQIEVDGNISCR